MFDKYMWLKFLASGHVDDYLVYCECRQAGQAAESKLYKNDTKDDAINL